MHIYPDAPEAGLPSLMANKAELLEPEINKQMYLSLDSEGAVLVQPSPDLDTLKMQNLFSRTDNHSLVREKR